MLKKNTVFIIISLCMIICFGLNAFASDDISFDDMSKKEEKYIMSLTDKGYDMDKVMAIYEFVKNTPREIYVIEDIYEIAKHNFDSPSWVENAYDVYIGDNRFKLDTEDVFNYVNKGIPPTDIMRCYEMSIMLDTPIRELLDKRCDGHSWEEIFIPEKNTKSSSRNPHIDKVASVVKISKHLKKDVAEILDDNTKELKIKPKYIKEFKEKRQANQKLKIKFKKTKDAGGEVND